MEPYKIKVLFQSHKSNSPQSHLRLTPVRLNLSTIHSRKMESFLQMHKSHRMQQKRRQFLRTDLEI